MRLLIDTDAGVDDAHAIMMALAQPNVEVTALTTVTGNIHVDYVNRNVFTILDVMQQDVPVYQGATQPLIHDWEWETEEFHGTDGLGDWPERPPSQRQIEAEHGVLALLRLANTFPGELTVVALGPMTNIALALRLDPILPEKVKQLVFMGGTIAAHGNTRIPTAEFNIYCDPEAAYITLQAFTTAYMISWETTLQHPLDWERFAALINLPGERARFFAATNSKMLSYLKSGRASSVNFLLPDPLAMAITLNPDLILASENRRVTVELNGTHTRGQTIVDYTNSGRAGQNVQVITQIDMDGVYELFRQMLGAPHVDT